MTAFALSVLRSVSVRVLAGLAFALLAWWGGARAETIPATGGTTYAATNAGALWTASVGGGTGTTQHDACKTMGPTAMAALAPGKTWDPTGSGVYYTQAFRYSAHNANGCAWIWTDPWGSNTTGYYGNSTYSATNYTCNAGDTLSGSTCTTAPSCPAGQGWTLAGSNCTRCDPLPGESRQPDGSCGCPSSGSMVGDTGTTLTFVPPATVTANTVCFGYCQFEADGCIKGYMGGTLAGTECYGPLKSSGASCNPATFGGGTVDPSQPLPREPNKPGHCWGMIGDKEVQLPCDSTSITSGNTKPSTTTTEKPDGTTETSTSTTESSTNCTGEACRTTQTTQTTTTTRDAQGNPTGTTTRTEVREVKPEDSDVGSFCQQNPTAAICQKSKWAGTCAAGFTCEGDAIQCAMAREVFNTNCALYGGYGGTITSAGALADFEADQDGKVTGPGRLTNEEVDGSTAFVTTERVYGPSSLADWTASVNGQTFVIPLSQMNTPLSYLGYIVLVFCTLWGALIMFGTKS